MAHSGRILLQLQVQPAQSAAEMSVSAVSVFSAVFGQNQSRIKDAPSSFGSLDERAFSRFSAVSAFSVNRAGSRQYGVNDQAASGAGRSRRRRSLGATPPAAPVPADPSIIPMETIR
jgi:hypothetical protein